MSSARRVRRARHLSAVVGGAAAVAALAAGCTAAVNGHPSPRPRHTHHRTSTPAPVTSPASTPVSSPRRTHHPRPSSTAPSTPTITRSSTPTTSAPVTTAPPASSSAPAPQSTCQSVSIRLIRGGAEQGTEIAALQFTNTGPAACTLVGYASVVLLRRHHRIGQPSQPGGPAPGRAVEVGPGQTVQSLLRDYSSCQAPLSDNARVTVPGSSITGVRPAELRACTLRVGQLGKPS